MTGLGVTMAVAAGSGLSPAAVAMCTTMAGCLAYTFPSGFAPVAMLHGDQWSESSAVYKFGFVMLVLSSIIITVVGYNLGTLLVH